ncbi:unnamed protein product [Phyllotreta striolata]|uniref:Uncharacterized protein n=1 Tax=Phyllotreta striolata TaxID=444603 RepID=A0A9N9XJ06_PHYSR|nr:unnamed protein product [Phyllotreta striolata]
MKLQVILLFIISAVSNALVVRLVHERGLLINAHGLGGVKMDPIHTEMLGLPSHINFNAEAEGRGRTYIGQAALNYP